jgi:hypothetical protein
MNAIARASSVIVMFAAALTAVLTAAACAPRDPSPAKPLSIVLLYADDWRHDTLGCAGNPVVQTPRLDQLARDGVRFTHNSVTTAICGVSRATRATWDRHNPIISPTKTPRDQRHILTLS